MSELLPEWSVNREIHRLLEFHSLAVTGISSAQGEPELMRALRDVQRGREGTPTIEEWNSKIEKAEQRRQAALRHSESEFSYLYELMIIKLWSIIESGIEEIAISCLRQPEKCKDLELLRTIKGPLIDFLAAPEDLRAELLYAELKVATKSALKLGVGNFESILQPLGMAGPVDDLTKRLILELEQKRNVLVHRRGIADSRLLNNCPFLEYKVGDLVIVNRKSAFKLAIGVGLYDLELRRRNYARANMGHPDELVEQRKALMEDLEWINE